MDIDKIIEEVATEGRKSGGNTRNFGLDQNEIFTKPEKKNPHDMTLKELKKQNLKDEDIRLEIYKKLKAEIDGVIDEYLVSSKDPKASEGMIKCYLETWQSCAHYIGLYYFNTNKYLRIEGIPPQGGKEGQFFIDDLLTIGLELYENYCNDFRKQFFIYDACRFLGMTKDTMYRLTELRSDILKKGHTAQESSYRGALASGRSNVTAMAILLNHDYDYTRTTQVIHTTEGKALKADSLPLLEDTHINNATFTQHENIEGSASMRIEGDL